MSEQNKIKGRMCLALTVDSDADNGITTRYDNNSGFLKVSTRRGVVFMDENIGANNLDAAITIGRAVEDIAKHYRRGENVTDKKLIEDDNGAVSAAAETLGDRLPEEQARVREVLSQYKELGAAGYIGAMLIELSLAEADQAVMSGDVIRMIAAYQDLKGIN